MAASATASVAMILVVLSATSSLPAAHADAGFIGSTCSKTSNAALCVAVLSGDPRSADAATAHDLAGIALDIAIDTAEESGKVIDDMAKDNQGTPVGDALNVCDGAYFDAANDLGVDARDSFDSGQYADAAKLLSVAKGAGDACEGAFVGIGVKPSPVADADRKMTEHCGVAADLVGLLVAAA